jgi:Ca2+-binding RTX toxin-like protein
MRPLPLLVLLSVIAVQAASAQAATVEVQGTTLRYTAAASERNHPILHHRAEDELVVYDSDFRRQTVTAGPGCAQDGDNTVVCPRTGVVAALFELGARGRDAETADSLTLTAAVPIPVAATAALGSGAGVSYIDLRPVAVTLDGVANDGPAGRGDNIGSGVDGVSGGDGTDMLSGNERDNGLFGDNGADQMSGGAGDDELTGATYNDVGADAVGLESRGADSLSCGPGRDVVLYDASDTITGDCELRVLVSDDGFSYRGTSAADRIIAEFGPARVAGAGGSDRLGATRFVGDVVLLGEAGADRLAGNAADDRLFGGSGDDQLLGAEGNDRLDGGSGRDRMSGGAGRDRFLARDGFSDTISCGSGRDTVSADARDRVSRDCERVSR